MSDTYIYRDERYTYIEIMIGDIFWKQVIDYNFQDRITI